MRTCRFGHMYDNFKMALFKYFKRTPAIPSLPTKLDSLSEVQLQKMNEHIWKTVGFGAINCGTLNKQHRHQYNKYSAKERADHRRVRRGARGPWPPLFEDSIILLV